ncbi:MAG: carbohydrate ABC transporter permease [Crenarchaeota archaeon]|nr:carbohydrate ABC transporter permease [Thermoproteota archaeon]
MKLSKLLNRVILYICLAMLTIFFLFPIYWIFASSFKPIEEIMTANPMLIPKNPTLEHYINLFSPTALYGGIERAGKFFIFFIRNSLITSSITVAISVIISVVGGYALSRYRFKGSTLLSRLMLLIYLFPGVLLSVPLFEIMAYLNIVNNHISLILVYVPLTASFSTWLMKAFFDTVPRELDEAVLVDGGNTFDAFTKVILPLSKPGLMTIIIFSFVTCWGEYLFASILINSDHLKLIAPGLAMYMGYQYIEWGSLLAGASLVTIPVLALFLPISRYFLRELVSGALKF